ncbi:unnamed protein product [Caenorhabditis brenneri]
MRFLLVFLTVLPFVVAFDSSEDLEFFEIKVDREHPEEVLKAFEDFKIKYNRKYKDASEAQIRFNNFVKTYNNVEKLNAQAKENGYDTKFGINKFADLSTAEFNTRLSPVQPNNTGIPMLDLSKPFFHETLSNKTRHKRRSDPEFIDLRQEKINGRYIVGPVKSQGDCACCWGFAVAGLVETVNAVGTGKFRSLSDQEICDCATKGTPGCKGGNLMFGMKYVKEFGLSSDAEYPYEDKRAYQSRRCRVRDTRRVVHERDFNYGTIDGRHAERQIKEVLYRYKTPVAVYFKVGEQFGSYKEGVIVSDDCPRGKTDKWHAGVIVGFSEMEANGRMYKYWIVKNSWDHDWAEDGYFRVIRGRNWCSIEEYGVTGTIRGGYNDYY